MKACALSGGVCAIPVWWLTRVHRWCRGQPKLWLRVEVWMCQPLVWWTWLLALWIPARILYQALVECHKLQYNSVASPRKPWCCTSNRCICWQLIYILPLCTVTFEDDCWLCCKHCIDFERHLQGLLSLHDDGPSAVLPLMYLLVPACVQHAHNITGVISVYLCPLPDSSCRKHA